MSKKGKRREVWGAGIAVSLELGAGYMVARLIIFH